MNTIRRQLLYAISAALIGIVCAAFLIFLAKHITAFVAGRHFTIHEVFGVTENPALSASLSPVQKQTYQNLDEDATGTEVSTYSKPHVVSASQYLVIDLTNEIIGSSTSSSTPVDAPFILADRTILQKDDLRAVPIASLTKLVTAVVAGKLLDENQPITITQDILNTDGNTADFQLGEKFSVSELLYPLLMVSSNDAGEALAQNSPNGRADFIQYMNAWVQSIGAYHTYFADPTGLSPDNVSDAANMAIIIRWIYLNRPDLIAITDTKVKEFRIHTWTNPTQLLNLSSYLGGKNGYIPQSGETAVSLFQVGSKLFAVVVLGSSNRDQDILELMREATGVPYITYENSNETTNKNTKAVNQKRSQTAAVINSRN